MRVVSLVLSSLSLFLCLPLSMYLLLRLDKRESVSCQKTELDSFRGGKLFPDCYVLVSSCHIVRQPHDHIYIPEEHTLSKQIPNGGHRLGNKHLLINCVGYALRHIS